MTNPNPQKIADLFSDSLTKWQHQEQDLHFIGESIGAPQSVYSNAQVASVGSSVFPAREDHQHDNLGAVTGGIAAGTGTTAHTTTAFTQFSGTINLTTVRTGYLFVVAQVVVTATTVVAGCGFESICFLDGNPLNVQNIWVPIVAIQGERLTMPYTGRVASLPAGAHTLDMRGRLTAAVAATFTTDNARTVINVLWI